MDKGKGRQTQLDGFLDNGLKPWLASLNDAQKEAVTWKSTGGLQILAGPGSGKTRVLTCRVAHLIKECGIKPEDLIVVTFTNKAANEMKHRLKTLLGEATVNKLTMGTFHSVAVRFLRKYGKHVDLPNNFVIADQGDCLSILKPIVAQHNATLNNEREQGGGSASTSDGEIKVKVVQNTISKSKAKGISPEKYLAEAEAEDYTSAFKLAMGNIYLDYQTALRTSNTLDFDDLLVFCERLFETHPNAVRNVKHVLVDEFQDTNTIQYNIVKHMSKASGALTIVGDPDQSIYSWRSAEVENLHFMLKDFPGTHQVWLEENYRSTSSILEAALAVIQQDDERIQKSLKTSHPVGPPVVLRKFESAKDEAAYIVYEIKRAIAYSGNQLTFDDFAILLRYNALSRAIEAALQGASVPSRMIGGHKFFERAEVKDILGYLQLAENPSYSPAFVRVVNVPKRGIGDKSIREIQEASKLKKTSCFDIVARALKGSSVGNVKPGQKTSLKPFVETITKVREMAAKGEPVSALIDFIVDKIGYKDHLERVYGPDFAARLENIHELKSYAEQVAQSNAVDAEETPDMLEGVPRALSVGDGTSASTPFDLDADDEAAPDVEAIPLDSDNHLRTFLAASMLSTDIEAQDESKNSKPTPKVTISTCHAAKGLEWPVVFLPASETGVYPAFQKSDNDEVAEERRLYYVAMTRGQAMLHMTHAAKRMERGQTADKALTQFLQPLLKDKSVLLVDEIPPFTSEMRACISLVTRKAAVQETSVQGLIDAFHSAIPPPEYETEESRFQSNYATGHPHLAYNKPTFAGQGWRMNAYAGDQAKRFASTLPNTGVNRFAGAFSTAPAKPSFSTASPATMTQAPGFTSALNAASINMSQSGPSKQSGSSFGTAKSAFVTSKSGQTSFSGSVNRPFKPPSMAKPTGVGAHHVATVETRLTQQHKAVILNPLPPNVPHKAGYSLPFDKEDSFSYLKGLPNGEMDDVAPPRPAGPKKRASSSAAPSSSQSNKRSK